MKHNLMGKEKIENLGFDQVNSWDNEEKVRLSCFFFLIQLKAFDRNIFEMLFQTMSNPLYRERETCFVSSVRSTKWLNEIYTGCVPQNLKLTTICTMCDITLTDLYKLVISNRRIPL